MAAIATHTVDTTARLAGLRELMRQPAVDVKVVVVPSEDERERLSPVDDLDHRVLTRRVWCVDFSEYPAEADKRRAFISGFSGSAGSSLSRRPTTEHVCRPGCAVITLKDAFLFTDGRYFLQAAKQLDGYVSPSPRPRRAHTLVGCRNWTLMKQGLPGGLSWLLWSFPFFTPDRADVPTWQEFLSKACLPFARPSWLLPPH